MSWSIQESFVEGIQIYLGLLYSARSTVKGVEGRKSLAAAAKVSPAVGLHEPHIREPYWSLKDRVEIDSKEKEMEVFPFFGGLRLEEPFSASYCTPERKVGFLAWVL